MTIQNQFRADFLAQVQSVAEDIDAAASKDYDALAEYFDNVLDVEIRVGLNGKFRSAKVLLCCGGPNITFDTKSGMVKGIWGRDVVNAFTTNETANAVDEYFEEMYNSIC